MQFRVAATPASATAIRVTIKLFAQYEELVGAPSVELELPQGATVADAVAALRRRSPNGGLLPERPMAALNLVHALRDQRLTDRDELALLPPLAGG